MVTRIVHDLATGKLREEPIPADELAVLQAVADPVPDPDEALRERIRAATTIAGLKAALLGEGDPDATRWECGDVILTAANLCRVYTEQVN